MITINLFVNQLQAREHLLKTKQSIIENQNSVIKIMSRFNEVAQTVLQKEENAWSQLQRFLKSKGVETADLFEVEKFITKIVNETLSNRTKTPFHEQ